MMGITAAAKIAVRPKILYQAATALRHSATTKVKYERNIYYLLVFI
jgi:hypothetical protein